MFKQGVNCRNQQCCLHFWLLLEDPFEQLSGIVKNVDRHGKPALFLIMPDSCLRIIQAKTKAVRRRKSVNNATISYTRLKNRIRVFRRPFSIQPAVAWTLPANQPIKFRIGQSSFSRYSGLTLNRYSVASPCRTICTVWGFVALSWFKFNPL